MLQLNQTFIPKVYLDNAVGSIREKNSAIALLPLTEDSETSQRKGSDLVS